MSVATAPAATSRFDWKRWPRTEAFVDRLIDRGLDGNGFAADLAGRMIRGDRHALEGLGRSPGRLGLARAGEDAGRSGIRAAADGLRRRRSGLRPSRRDLSPDRAGSVIGRAATKTGSSACAIWPSRWNRSPRSRGPTTWAWRSWATRMGPYRTARVARRPDRPGRGRAAGLPGVRAVSR